MDTKSLNPRIFPTPRWMPARWDMRCGTAAVSHAGAFNAQSEIASPEGLKSPEGGQAERTTSGTLKKTIKPRHRGAGERDMANGAGYPPLRHPGRSEVHPGLQWVTLKLYASKTLASSRSAGRVCADEPVRLDNKTKGSDQRDPAADTWEAT